MAEINTSESKRPLFKRAFDVFMGNIDIFFMGTVMFAFFLFMQSGQSL